MAVNSKNLFHFHQYSRKLLAGTSLAVALSGIFITSGCEQQKSDSENTANSVAQTKAKSDAARQSSTRAESIAHQYLITDTHVDVPYRLQEKYEDVANATKEGNFDYPRAVKGGLDAPFMSIYVPSKLDGTDKSFELANQLIDSVEKLVSDSPDKFALATSPQQLAENKSNGLISLPMGMENGAPVGKDLANLKHFFDRGIRYITLTHAKANQISDSSYDKDRPNQGLSDFGKQVVKEMNRLGIMVDVSHISDQAFEDVMATSVVPVIASHSSARFFTPGFERNMSDEMIKKLAAKGGIIQINFGSSFISEKANQYSLKFFEARKSFMEQNNVEGESEAVKRFTEAYRKENPPYFASLEEVLAHFDHVRELVGVDHLGIGSDYDGVGDSLPVGLKDVSTYPNLIKGLLDHGYSEQDIEKILGANLIRVWKQVESYAKKQG